MSAGSFSNPQAGNLAVLQELILAEITVAAPLQSHTGFPVSRGWADHVWRSWKDKHLFKQISSSYL